ncbi:hypothetical protein LXL04_008236 [Taraxacum kok-saghyz]
MELRVLCKKIGNLEDIYLAGRRNATGLFFAFLKFTEVNKPEEVEAALNEIHLRGRNMKANLAKHPRRQHDGSRPIWKPVSRAPKQVGRPIRSAKDSKTFVDVAMGTSAKPLTHPLPIPLIGIKEVQQWCSSASLVGEIKNFDLLCNFSSLILLEGYDITETRYLGGMQVIIKFNSVQAARVFKANKSIWMKWFVWVEPTGTRLARFERIAWIKITGLPLQAWDETNMEAVAGSFGKVLVNISPFWNNKDVSHRKLCTLTASRKKLNEEISVSLDGVEHRIEVFEVDDDWIPFKNFESVSASDSDEEMDDEEKIPESWHTEEDDAEEGEFKPESENVAGNNRSPANSSSTPAVGGTWEPPAQIPRETIHEESHGDSCRFAKIVIDKTRTEINKSQRRIV